MLIRKVEVKLPNFDGRLIITRNDWEVRFVFLESDLRYRPTILSIKSSEIDGYIKALSYNWLKFEKMKNKFSFENASTEIIAVRGMVIKLGLIEGLYLDGKERFLKFETKEEVITMINDLRWAKVRAKEVVDKYKSISK